MKTRLTELRKEISEIVNGAEKPLSVKAIQERAGAEPNLSTVYRALDYLEKKRYVQSVTLFDGTRALLYD